MKYIIPTLLLTFAALLCTGCGKEDPRESAATMSNMRQIGIARVQAFSTGQEPNLSDIGQKLSIDISNFETTDAWAAAQIGENPIVLKTKDGKFSLMADGSVHKN